MRAILDGWDVVSSVGIDSKDRNHFRKQNHDRQLYLVYLRSYVLDYDVVVIRDVLFFVVGEVTTILLKEKVKI